MISTFWCEKLRYLWNLKGCNMLCFILAFSHPKDRNMFPHVSEKNHHGLFGNVEIRIHPTRSPYCRRFPAGHQPKPSCRWKSYGDLEFWRVSSGHQFRGPFFFMAQNWKKTGQNTRKSMNKWDVWPKSTEVRTRLSEAFHHHHGIEHRLPNPTATPVAAATTLAVTSKTFATAPTAPTAPKALSGTKTFSLVTTSKALATVVTKAFSTSKTTIPTPIFTAAAPAHVPRGSLFNDPDVSKPMGVNLKNCGCRVQFFHRVLNVHIFLSKLEIISSTGHKLGKTCQQMSMSSSKIRVFMTCS